MLTRVLLATILALGGALPIAAQPRASETPASSQAPEADALPFIVQGNFDLGLRWRDTSGNEDKYFEDLNYRTGPRLFNLDLDVTPSDRGAFDLLNVHANGIGDPFQGFGVTMKKFGGFNFRFRRNQSAYFYRDTLVPHEDSSPSLSDAGDFRTFNFDRTNDLFAFDFKPTARSSVFLNLNRQTRVGESTAVLDLSRDEFEVDRPLDETKNDFTVGFQADFRKATLYVDETIRHYDRGDARTFLPGASLGENPDNATEVFFFDQLLPFDFTMPQTTVRLNVRPSARLRFTGGVIVSDLDAEFSLDEQSAGIAFTGAPFENESTGRGEIDRTTKVADFDLTYDASDHVALIGAVRVARFDQTGMLDEEGSVDTTGVDIATETVELGTQLFPRPGLTVTGGYRYEARDTAYGHLDEALEEVDTRRNSIFVNGVLKPSPALSLLGEYERGDYDNPFTLIAPTSMDRFKVRVRALPTDGLSVTGTFLARRLSNDLAGAVHPTDPREGRPTQLDSTNFTVHVAYDVAPVSVFGNYSRHNVTNDVRNVITTLPGFGGGQRFDYVSLYESDIDRGAGGLTVDVHERVCLGTMLSAYRNRGTFGLDWEQYRLFTELLTSDGYLLKLAYQYNSLDESLFTFDDYSAHMVTLSVGYRF